MSRTKRRYRKFLVAAAMLAAPVCAPAQISGTWNNRNSGTWTDPANWNSFPDYPSGGGNAVFPSSIWAPVVVTFPNTTISLSSISVDGPAAYTIAPSGTLFFAGPANINVGGPELPPAFFALFGGAHSIQGISTTSGLVKTGPGAILSTVFNNVTGGLTIKQGAVVVGGNFQLPTTVGTLTLDGGELRISDFSSFATPPIVVGAAGGTISGGGSQFSLGNNLTGTSTLNLEGTSSNGFILAATTVFSGVVDVKSSLQLSGQGAMSLISGMRVAGMLSLNNLSGTVVSDRISDNATIQLRGGTISASGASSAPNGETLGVVTLDRGLTTIASNQYASLTLAGLARSNRAALSTGTIAYTLVVTGAGPTLSGSGAAGTPDVGIVPWARAEGASISPVTLDGGVLRALGTSEFINSLPVGVSASNLKIAGDATVTTPATVNSLTLVLAPATFSQTLGGSSTLTVSSGAVFVQPPPNGLSPRTTISAPLDFGAAEGVLHTNFPGTSRQIDFTGPISGTNGLTIAGGLSLRGSNTYTGQTTLLGRLNIFDDVTPGVAGPLGLDTSPMVVDGGASVGLTFYPQPGGTIHFGRDLIVSSFNSYGSVALNLGNLIGATVGSAVISSNIEINGNLGLIGAATPGANGFIFTGHITGPGRLINPSYVTLTGSNSFSGGVLIGTGGVMVGNDHALGSGTIWMSAISGTSTTSIGATTTVTLANPVVLAAPFLIGGNFPLTFSGPVNLYGGTRTVTVSGTSTAAFTGDVYNGGITKQGGMLNMSRLNVPTLTISSGTMKINPNGTDAATSRVQVLTIASAGAAFDLTDNDLIYDYTASGAAGPTAPSSFIQQHLANNRIFTTLGDHDHLALGYADNTSLGLSSFDGQPIDSSSVLIKFTYRGDTNLDGQVDIRDLLPVATHYNAAGTFFWFDGDFNYDGHVDIADLTLLAENWQAGVGSAVPGESLGSALAALGLPAVTVPEPALASCLGVCLMVKIGRRRRSVGS